MTKELDFNAFSRHLTRVVAAYPEYLMKGMKAIGEGLTESAKDKIGHLQTGGGPFESWAPLAPATLADKENQGFLFNSEGNPLYRTGEMMESISSVFNMISKILYLGSTSEKMLWQELGTVHIPPRSVLGLTMYKALAVIAFALRMLFIDWILLRPIGRGLPHGSI